MKICYGCFNSIPDDSYTCPICGFDPEKQKTDYPAALKLGSVLSGRYIVGKVLGQGGFGITYMAREYKTKQIVAIKEYFPETLAMRSQNKMSVSFFAGDRQSAYQYGKDCFLTEAKTLSKFIGNESIVRVHNFFEENGTAYLTMEYIDGESLMRYIKKRGGRISFEEARLLLLPVMKALESVHAAGIIHRDISPDNIHITTDGTIKLIDFGAARYSLGDRSRSLDVVLKHGYAPVEQYTRRGRQGPYTDVYSMSATFYRAITGRVPPESIDRMTDDNLVPPTNLGVRIPEQAEITLLKGLEVNYRDRLQTMRELRIGIGSAPLTTDFGRSSGNSYRSGSINGYPYDSERKAREEAERRMREEAERKAREEAERRMREEAERKAREEAERRMREEAERKAREEAERRMREEAERKAREEAERRMREEAIRRIREEAERKVRAEMERRAREEAERKAREEAERKAREEAERKAREEAERKAREEAERKAREEAERRAREEAERKAREEAERKAREEAERKAREEAERRAREEAERKAREEAERKAREEAERKAREEAERKAREEAERRAREEAERKAREEAERKAREEAERKAREEAERRALEEAERKAREEAERKAREEAERKAREEAERKAREEAERRAREEAERKAREEAERKAREEAERKARAEAERRAREEAERKAREEAERRAREEAERRAREEAERKARAEAERRAREEAERKARAEAERKAREEAERKARRAREEAKRAAKEQAARKKQEDAARKAQIKAAATTDKNQAAIKNADVKKKDPAFSEKKSGKKKKKIIIISSCAAAVVLIAILSIFLIIKFSQPEEKEETIEYITVPDMFGMDIDEAEQMCDDKHLVLKEDGDRVNSDTVKAGCIISQSYAEGAEVVNDTVITVSVSKGKSVKVPDIVGKSKSDAEKALKNVDLVLNVASSEYSDKVAKDCIIKVNNTDEYLDEGSKVNVVVSKGVEQVTVPNLSGKTAKEAKAALEKVGLKYKEGSAAYSDKVAKGKVIKQDQKADSKVDKGTTVTVTLSKGKKPAATEAPTNPPANNNSGSSGSGGGSSDSGGSYDDGGYDYGGYDDGGYDSGGDDGGGGGWDDNGGWD